MGDDVVEGPRELAEDQRLHLEHADAVEADVHVFLERVAVDSTGLLVEREEGTRGGGGEGGTSCISRGSGGKRSTRARCRGSLAHLELDRDGLARVCDEVVDPALRRLHGESVRAEEAIQELDRERRGVHVQGEGELVLDDALHEYPAKLRQLGELGLTRHHRGVLRALVRDGAADLLHAAFDEPLELVALLRLAHDTNFERSNRLLGGEARAAAGGRGSSRRRRLKADWCLEQDQAIRAVRSFPGASHDASEKQRRPTRLKGRRRQVR